MSWRLPLSLLIAVLVLSGAITLHIYGRQDVATISSPVGIRFSTSSSARAIDEEISRLQSRGRIPKELKVRLNHPPRAIEINGFYLDTCEVSQLRYEQFFDYQYGILSDEEKKNSPYRSASTGHRVAGRLDSAASGVSFAAAQNYCQASGGRLPFAEELEIAASGAEGRLYPWGNEFTDHPWPYKDAGRNAAQLCGAQTSAATPSGIFDLASNVMEWGQGYLKAQTRQEAVSAHGAPPTGVRGRELFALNSAWLLVKPEIQSHHLGFRCAYDEPPRIQIWSFNIPDAIYIPGGNYIVGLPADARLPRFIANLPDVSQFSIENLLVTDVDKPQTIDVSKCEISREEYAKFLRDPLVNMGLFGNDNEPKDVSYEPLDWETQKKDPVLPVTGVNWWSADAYARWVGGRLPTVDEWRQLATGEAATSYPWGNDFQEALDDHSAVSLEICGVREFDHTPLGISDLGGNVSEWTKSVSADRGRLAMWVQGGNWRMFTPETASSLFGRLIPLNHRSESIGFRVVFD
ncbi:MAG: SUMF1/EgtB/PvdO family nonheme iron enzyme [Gammaproteobacteria bacterium]|nr:SUMF1/EgtB/PvdO family nonheme iron enzyme [Gammaproteobacteria bacterium]